MQNSKSKIPFQGTKEQETKLIEVINNHKSSQGAIMPILQEAQEIYGYLPIEVQKLIAKGLKKPLEEIYGIVTFYSQFSLNPKGKYKISVCLGTACYVRKVSDILEKIERIIGIKGGECTADGQFSLEACRCVGACGLAPVIIINGDVYGRLKVEEVDGIIAKYRG